MINLTIPANQVFSVPADKFGLYAAQECQLQISVDGTNFSDWSDPFTGVQFWKDNPRSCYLKCNVEVHLSY